MYVHAQAVDQDRKLQQAWAAHTRHVVVANNGGPRGFAGKLEEATEAVLAIARLAHPGEVRRAKEIRDSKRQACPSSGESESTRG